jgi:putative Mg2+ transporter-C (MgtC) family protein
VLGHGEIIARIAAGAVLGGVIGYERDRHGRPVGLRTHLIVAMAAATFMVISTQLVYHQRFGKDDLVEVDASRVAASIVSGIGFLAGGAILRQGVTIQGLTTAAGLWLVTAIGMSAGAGMLVESVAVTSMGIVALTVLRRFEDKNDELVRRRVVVVLAGDAPLEPVVNGMSRVGVVVNDSTYRRRLGERPRLVATFEVKMPHTTDATTILTALEKVPGVRRVSVEKDG